MFRRKTLILDNYDSFTYNLYQYLGKLKGNPLVKRNDQVSLEEIFKMAPTHVVISPGPGRPEVKEDFGVCLAVIQKFTGPILGVCLGHQGIIYAYGGKIVRTPVVKHGKVSLVRLYSSPLFQGLPRQIEAMRYHSLMGERRSLPKDLKVIAETEKAAVATDEIKPWEEAENREGETLIMGVQHVKRPLFGVQFHPESIGTPIGKQILKNFLSMTF